MYRLLEFIRHYRDSFTFVSLLVLCFWLIILNNSYQNVVAFNTANFYVGKILTVSNKMTGFFSLWTVNQNLANENAMLKNLLKQKEIKSSKSYRPSIDSLNLKRYNFIPSKVINNSVNRINNYLTIDKGEIDGCRVGMAVISGKGVVGKIKNTSKHFSTVITVLHTGFMLSAKHKRTGQMGSMVWEGNDYLYGTLLYIPRQHKMKLGDTIETSGYSDVFPSGVNIGRISKIEVKGDESNYKLKIKYSTDFNALGYVYVVNDVLRNEQDSLETSTTQSIPELIKKP